tara:strand:+ start:789 stop:947 length:159 start_codon:yes stop_codon:yes gene_type:complete
MKTTFNGILNPIARICFFRQRLRGFKVQMRASGKRETSHTVKHISFLRASKN